MSRLKKPVVLLAALYAFAVGSGVALAYYTSLGAGTGVANVGSLTAPTLNTPVPGAGTAALTWSFTPPQADTVTYTVSRDGSEAAGTCAGSLTATTCTDSGVTAGPHEYTVTAHWRTWTATSSPQSVSLVSGAPSKLAFTTQPSSSTGGVAFPTQPAVTVQDADGNTVTSDSSQVTLAITSGSGTAGASLTCGSNPLAASGGVATFSGCKIDKAGTGYTLTATDGSLTSAVSNTFDIAVGSVSQLVFTTQPSGATTGVAFTQQPVVTAEDAGGNAITSYAGTVSLSVKSGTANLFGCTASLSAGATTFSGCKINTVGTGYQLTASDGTRTIDSAAFNVALGVNVPLIQAIGPVTTFGLLSSDTAEVVQYPEGHAVGDLLFLVACANQENGNPLPGSFGAWTRDNDSGPIKDTATNSMHCSVYRHVEAAGETSASILIKASATTTAGGELWVLDYRKPGGGAPTAAGAIANTDRTQASTASTFSPVPWAVTSAPANEILFVVNRTATSLSLTTSGGFTLDGTYTVTSPGAGGVTVTLGVASAIRSTTGTPATPTWTGAPAVWYADFAPWG